MEDQERQALIVAQAVLKAASSYMSGDQGGVMNVTQVAEIFERWVYEAPKRSLSYLTNRVVDNAHQAPVQAPQPVPQPQEGPSYACPQCGTAPMVLRSSTYGQFYGCSRYRDGCRGTRDIGGRVKTG